MGSLSQHETDMSELTHRLATEYAVSRILAEAGDPAESLARALLVMGQELDWDYCVCWRLQPGSETMRLLASWQRDSGRLRELEEAVQAATLRPGLGLAGRVWAKAQTEWVEDAGQPGNFFLAAEAHRAGIDRAVCCPILFQTKIVGLLELLTGRETQPHPVSLTVLENLAGQIGHFLNHTTMAEALRVSEAHFRALFDANIAGVHCSTLDGRPLAVNASFVKMFGFQSAAEAMAVNSTDFYLDPRERDELIEHLRRYGRDVNRELRLRHRDGHTLWVLCNTVMIPGLEGQPDGNESTLLDITEAKDRTRRQWQVSKLESMGRLASGLAHDFNNFLGVINGYADLALNALEANHPAHEALEKLRAAGDSAAALTRQLLAFGHRPESEPEALDLVATVRTSLGMLAETLGPGVRVRIEAAPELAPVRAQAAGIHQIVMNLAINARDAMPGGGDLLVQIDPVTIDAEYTRHHVQARQGEYLQLAVSDTGEGMDADTRRHVFEPLFTTKPAGKGTGLGLSSVYSLMNQHRGWIELYSERGHGTTFKLYFPVAGATARLAAPTVASAADPADTGATVVLVDDERNLLQLMRDILEQKGYRVIAASSGQEALSRVRAAGRSPELLITDLVVPGGGPVLAAQLSVATLYVSGFTLGAATAQGLLPASHDPGAFLQKPFSPSALLEHVAVRLQQHRAAGA
ncbi:MAG: PAS domain S-box protein [Acidobacteria bacterium]|nr:MAG: PAS domain S-box protein [Acidobacteriota bacterium]